MQNRIYYSKDAERRVATEKFVLALVAVVGGLGLGAVIALLLAPQTGDRTRKQLEQGVEKTFEEGKHQGAKVLEQVRRGVDDVRDEVEKRVKSA